jgi:hypothetical protein
MTWIVIGELAVATNRHFIRRKVLRLLCKRTRIAYGNAYARRKNPYVALSLHVLLPVSILEFRCASYRQLWEVAPIET